MKHLFVLLMLVSAVGCAPRVPSAWERCAWLADRQYAGDDIGWDSCLGLCSKADPPSDECYCACRVRYDEAMKRCNQEYKHGK